MARYLQNILESQTKLDNTLVWDGYRHPFHESYDVKVNDTMAGWALWLRYALCHPTSNKKDAHARLIAAYADNKGERTILTDAFDLSRYDIVHADQFIGIKDSFLSLAETNGQIANLKQNIKWELSFEDPATSLRIYPNNLFYRFVWPRTKYLQPRLKCFATGQVYINHQKKTLNRHALYQSHTYGTAFPLRWARASCIGFKEDSSAWFEGLSIQPSCGSRPLKPIPFFCIAMDGKKFSINSLFKVFTSHSEYSADTWFFAFKKNGFKFEGKIFSNHSSTIGFTNKSPQNNTHYSYVSMRSKIEIVVLKKTRRKWTHYKTLTSPDACWFETSSANRLKEFPLDIE